MLILFLKPANFSFKIQILKKIIIKFNQLNLNFSFKLMFITIKTFCKKFLFKNFYKAKFLDLRKEQMSTTKEKLL